MENFYSFMFGQGMNNPPIVGPTNLFGKNRKSDDEAEILHIREREVGFLDDVFVLNVANTTGEDPQIEAELPPTCANEDCPNECDGPDIVRAHVRIKGEDCPEDEAWICNLCHSCNSDDNHKAMKLQIGTKLFPVKMKEPHATVEEEISEGDNQMVNPVL